MAGRGSWVAVTHEEAENILSAKALNDPQLDSDDEARMEVLQQTISVIDEDSGEEFWCYADKAWWGIHCCLIGGKTDWETGEYPLQLCVLGGQKLCEESGNYAFYVSPEQVQDVGQALEKVSEFWFREQYGHLEHCEDYEPPGVYGDEDFEYLWAYFEEMTGLFRRAAATGKAVVFECG